MCNNFSCFEVLYTLVLCAPGHTNYYYLKPHGKKKSLPSSVALRTFLGRTPQKLRVTPTLLHTVDFEQFIP